MGACALVIAAFRFQFEELETMILLLMCTLSGSAYCFLMNDIYDRKKDLLNKKRRPIATGELPLNVAIGFTIVLGLLFLVCTYQFRLIVFLLSIVFIFLTTIYSFLNIKSGILANVIVAFIVSGTQWGVAFIEPDPYLIPASLFLFFFTIPREMMLDWLDIDGDKEFGKNSVALSASKKGFKLILTFLLFLVTLSAIFIINQLAPKPISLSFFLLAALSGWISFVRFFQRANRKNALFGIRFSHVTFGLFIVAMLIR